MNVKSIRLGYFSHKVFINAYSDVISICLAISTHTCMYMCITYESCGFALPATLVFVYL